MFFGDYSAGFLKVLNLERGRHGRRRHPFATQLGRRRPDPRRRTANIAFPDFGTGEPGTGSIKEIVYAPSAGAPHAVATATPDRRAASR